MASSSGVIKRLLRWGKVSRDGDDAENYPVQQVTYLGKVGDALMWFPYGYHAVVPDDTLAFLASMQGNSEARVGFPGSPTLRPRITSPEVVVYHPPTGSKIHFRANGDIEVEGVDLRVTTTGPTTITAGGDVTVNSDGDVDVNATGGNVKIDAPNIEAAAGATLKLMNENVVAIFNAHKHSGGGNPPTTTLAVGTDTTTKLKGS